MKKISYSWIQFEEDCDLLYERIKKNFNPSTIVCIATGGLPLGTVLHNKFDKPLTIISAKSYTETKQGTILLNSSYTVPMRSPVLLVDEICDTGKTMKLVKNHIALGGVEVRTATLFYKEHSIYKPDWYLHKSKNEWIEFCWEK